MTRSHSSLSEILFQLVSRKLERGSKSPGWQTREGGRPLGRPPYQLSLQGFPRSSSQPSGPVPISKRAEKGSKQRQPNFPSSGTMNKEKYCCHHLLSCSQGSRQVEPAIWSTPQLCFFTVSLGTTSPSSASVILKVGVTTSFWRGR